MSLKQWKKRRQKKNLYLKINAFSIKSRYKWSVLPVEIERFVLIVPFLAIIRVTKFPTKCQSQKPNFKI